MEEVERVVPRQLPVSVPAGPRGALAPARAPDARAGRGPLNALLESYRTRMPITQVERGFMPEVYEHSVWVVHFDHRLGLEAFGRSS
jgi:hypothetical protein